MRTKHPHLYGPVPSRRLGYSLGVDLLPLKTCSMDCVYCQLGGNPRTTVRRKEFVPVETILAEIADVLRSGERVDAVTFSGSGEPTLYSGMARLIRGIKRLTSIPVILLTNGSLFSRPAVRRAAAEADVVVPSLDAATESAFQKVNRPYPGLTAAEIIDGLAEFRREYRGQIWLEVLLVKGLNDRTTDLKALKTAVSRIKPDRVQLNTVVRPPAEGFARPLTRAELEKIRIFLGGKTEIIASFGKKSRNPEGENLSSRILDFVRRRPETPAAIGRALGTPARTVSETCRTLEKQGRLRAVAHRGKVFFEAVSLSNSH